MGQRTYCLSRMEVSYCTFGFGAIIQCNLCTLLPSDSPCHNHKCVHDLGPCKNSNSCLLGRLSYKQIWRYNNSPPYVTARWSRHIFPLYFLHYLTMSRSGFANFHFQRYSNKYGLRCILCFPCESYSCGIIDWSD